MHPFIHPLTSAVDPVWEAKSDWDIFKGFARSFSELCDGHLGVEQDVVLSPLMHDTPDELGQALEISDWKHSGDKPIPGKTMPNVSVIERDYPATFERFTSLGPLISELGNGIKGVNWQTAEEVEELANLNGTHTTGAGAGRPRIETDRGFDVVRF